MDQLICASLSHTHYWYEVDTIGMKGGGGVIIHRMGGGGDNLENPNFGAGAARGKC